MDTADPVIELPDIPIPVEEVKGLAPFLPIALGVVGIIGSYGLGYYMGKRNRVIVVPAEPEQEVRRVVSAAKQKKVEEEPRLAPIISAEDYDEHKRLITDYTAPHVEVEVEVPQPEPELQNVFATSEDGWSYPDEQAWRAEHPDLPHILHKDEFYAEELGYAQTTLTYYAEDHILADEQDKEMPDFERVTGPLRFGHGSSDPRTLHVRNHKYHAEYEILLHDGSYAREVLGVVAEERLTRGDLKHSQRRMREE